MWSERCRPLDGSLLTSLSRTLGISPYNKCTIISDHIGYFLNLCHHIIEAGKKLDDIYVVYAILLSLPRSSIWDVIKQNLLDKGKALTLDMVSAKLISVCKGTTLGLGLVTWVGSHLRAVVSPIAFPLSVFLLFCDILCEPLNLILDFVGIYVRYHENGA